MDTKILVFVIGLAFFVARSDAAECCTAYTDLSGNHHPTQICEDYCCFDLSLKLFTNQQLKTCCSDINRRVPSEMRDEDCTSWLKEHIWVPIVCSIVSLIILVAICTCCCCCGCCACCRRSQPGVIVTGPPAGAMVVTHTSSHTSGHTNPAHVGYNQ